MADNAECSGYSGGSLAGAIIGTFAATILLLGLIYLVWEWQKKRRIKRSGLHNLVIVEDGGGGGGSGGDTKGFAYDNPGFIDESSSEAKKSQQGGGLDAKFNGTGTPMSQQNGGKKMPWGPLSFLFKSRNALDDSVMEEPQKYSVALKGHDFTGLGFNVCGNMRDGIFVKDIMQRGPAAESKQILLGDQITGMTVSFKQMVLEDALTLLSYASPYEVTLDMLRLPEKSLPHKGIFLMSSPAHPSGSSGQSNTLERVCHPFFKSQSIDDLRKVGKEHLDLQVDRKKKQANGIHTSKTPSTTTVTGGTIDIPTVVVVGNNENRSSSSSKATSSAVRLPKMPKMNFSFGSSSSSNTSPKPTKAPEAHQKASSPQIQIPMPDEVDGAKNPVVISVTKPEIIPRSKAKTSNVQKSVPAGEDMELVEAISPAIDKMTAEFEKNKKESMQKIKVGVPTSAVLDVQPVEIDMSGQPSVKIESSSSTSIEMPTMKVDMPTADVDVRAPSMIIMSGDSKKKEDKKEGKKKEKPVGKQKGGSMSIDLTPPSFSFKSGSAIEMKEGERADSPDSKKTKNQKSKEKAEKSKEKENNKKAEKEAKEKTEKEAKEKAEKEAKEKAEKDAKEKAEKEAKVKAEKEAKAEKASKEKAEKDAKEKAEKEAKVKAEKEAKEKDSSDQQQEQQAESSGGEKSKFFKFGIPVLPDIGLNFGFGGGKSSPSVEDKEKDKNTKEKDVKEEIKEVSLSTSRSESPMKEKVLKKEKSPEPTPSKDNAKKDDKKDKEPKEKASKTKDKNKEKEEKEISSKQEQVQDEQQESMKEVSSPPTKEKSGSSFSFNLKLPSFDKPLLKRKDSSSSTSAGEGGAEPAVDSSPNAASNRTKDSSDMKTKNDKSATEASPAKTKKKAEKKEKKAGSRPTSPEISEGHRTTDDEADKSMDVVDSIPGEKSSKKGGGFHMPHIGIKLPKFGHSKQTYSFENAGDNKDLKHSHGPTAEALLESNQSMSLELSANTPEFKKMTPTPDAILPEVAVKMDQPPFIPDSSSMVKNVVDEVDSAEVKVEIEGPKVTLPKVELPSTSMKVEMVEKEGTPAKPEEKSEMTKVSEDEMNKKEDENKDKQSSKDKESKPSFVSKGLKGLRDLKDKVTHKLSNDPQQHSAGSSSEEEGEPGEGKMAKEKVKKEKKTKESREKSKEDKLREKEEKLKEKEKLKAEKKLRKAEMKKKSANHSSSSSSSSSSDESDADEGKDKKEKKKLKTKEKSNKDKKAKKEKKGEKSDKSKSVGIEVNAEMPSVEMQTSDINVSTSMEQKQVSAHEAKLIPAKPPVVPRKSRDSSKDDNKAEMTEPAKSKLKKTKSKGGASASSSSSSSESDGENKNNDREGKPKKPKRTPKRKAPEIPSITTIDVPDIVKITTSAEVISPPREESGKYAERSGEMRESSKTPESGRRSASFGDLSSLQQPKLMGDGPLERAMSMDMAGDKENEPGTMPVGSFMEDLSAGSDSKTINHLTRGQQQLHGLRDSIASTNSYSSNETLKSTPTSVIQVHPKELQQTLELPDVSSTQTSQVTPIAAVRVTTTASQPDQDPQSSTIQKMMNETLSVMNNIVHEMDSPSLVKSAMSAAGQASRETGDSSHVTISTSGTRVDDKQEAEKVAQQTVDEIMVKASQSLKMPEMSVSVNKQEQGPKVSVTTGDCNEPVVNNIVSDLTHSLSADMEGGADSFSIASVKIQGMDGDSDEPISVRNITVTNIKNEPKTTIVDEDNAGDAPSEEGEESASTSSGSGKQLMRGDSKARLLQTVADANDIKVAPATPLRKDSSLSSSSCSVDSSPDAKSDGTIKPNFSIETKVVHDGDNDQQKEKTNGQTIEISSAELDGIMMSHADFLQKQAAVIPTSSQDDSLDEPDHLRQQLKDTFDNWVYVEQKNAAHEHTCPHSHSDPEPSTSSSNDDDEGPYSRNGALSPTTYRMETEYKFETSEMRVTSSPIPPAEAHVKSQSTVYSTTMTLPQKTVTQITLGDPVMDAGGRIVSKITLDTSSQSAEDANVTNKGSSGNNAELPKLESLK